MSIIRAYFNPYRTRFVAFSNVIYTYVITEDYRKLDLNYFAGLSLEQSNLMVVLKQPLPESVFPLVKHVISGYTNRIDADNALLSLCESIKTGDRLWDVNVFNQHIPYKVNY